MNDRSECKAGFTLIEIMIVVALIGLLASIAIPNFIRSRQKTQTNVCINNLREIDYAVQQWALEARKAFNTSVEFSDISGYLRRSVICPAGGKSFADSYTVSTVGLEPVCQKVPTKHLLPSTVLLAGGDSNPTTPTTPNDSNSGHNGAGHGHGNHNGNNKGP